MSWVSKGLKKLGKGVKKVAKGAGKVWEKIDDVALPALGFALGGPAGAALGSAAARGIGDGKFNLGATVGAGVKGYALGGLGQAAGLQGGQGVGSLLSSGKAAITNPVGTASRFVQSQVGAGGAKSMSPPSLLNANISADGVVPAAVKAASGAANPSFMVSIGEGIKKVGGYAMKNPDLILGGLSGIQGYQADKKADALRKQQMQLAMGNWNDTAGLRKMGQSMMLDQSREDLAPLYRNRSNPFSA